MDLLDIRLLILKYHKQELYYPVYADWRNHRARAHIIRWQRGIYLVLLDGECIFSEQYMLSQETSEKISKAISVLAEEVAKYKNEVYDALRILPLPIIEELKEYM